MIHVEQQKKPVTFTKFFTSQACFDFSAPQTASHAVERPFRANSMCHKILMRMVHGEPMSSWKAQRYGSSGDRRLREVLDWLREQGMPPASQQVTGETGAHYLEWSMDTAHRLRVLEMYEKDKRHD